MPISNLKDTSAVRANASNFSRYTVTIDNFNIQTIITSDATVVKNWIQTTESIHNDNTDLVVGLDVEWGLSSTPHTRNPVAIIQLSIADRCLIYQILKSNIVPVELPTFLQRYKFVGVGIREDVSKLIKDYDLEVKLFVDLRDVAVKRSGDVSMKQLGLKKLARNVLGIEMEKSMEVTMSNWAATTLDWEQMKYAVADAYVSYKLGTVMQAYKYC